MDDALILKNRLKEARGEKKLSQAQLAEILPERQAEAVYAYFHGGKEAEKA